MSLYKFVRKAKFGFIQISFCIRIAGNRKRIPFFNAIKKLCIASVKPISFGLVMATCFGPTLTAASLTSISVEADKLYDQMKYAEICDLLSPYKDAKNDEILWRLARATFEKAKAATNDAEKKALFREALNYVESALEINENNFAVHKWMSILLDYVYAYDGTKARISKSYIVKDHMQRACELKPNDGTSWHLLGLWYYNVAEIPWYQRKIAAVIFTTPPSGTYEEALENFIHAENVEPNFYSTNLLMIGKCHQKLGNMEEAKKFLLSAQNYKQKTQDDEDASAEAVNLLSKMS